MKDNKKYDWSKEIYGSGKDEALWILMGFMIAIFIVNII